MKICTCKTQRQLEELAALADEIWHEYFVDLLSPRQIDYMVEKFQSLSALERAVRQEGYTYFLLYDADRLIGYCGVKPEETRLFLSKLYLHKSQRGKGLSTRLYDCAVEYARQLGKSAIYLTCNKYNRHSLDVYRAKGFYEIDSVQTDIGHGFIMDDYVLQKDIA